MKILSRNFIVFVLLFTSVTFASVTFAAIYTPNSELSLDYYLPEKNTYDKAITPPEKFLGFQVGEWHARYDQIVAYMSKLAGESDRVSIIEMGYSWEQRPQILVAITSPENQSNLDQIIRQRSDFANLGKQPSPLVVWLGYSVHGNEASGTNTSLISAYHLSAKTGAEHEQFLKDTVVVIEPSLNPDGYGRFSTWVNNNRSMHLSADNLDREHMEGWPNGRTNHYRFDLNRDWLLAQHRESKNRLNWFHKLRPHVLGDFHEMGPNSTYFFQPGVPSRQHPLTPEENFEITDAIARYHAKILDEAGSLYYSKENFDDFYYGKGSTYPDINGGVGILFEQASARGHLQNSVNGPISLPFAIKNHFLTTLSTLEGAYAERDRLIDYQQSFYDKALSTARSDNSRGVVVSSDGDHGRLSGLVEILLHHKIKVYQLATAVQINGLTIRDGIIIPFNQPQYRLIKSIFETRTKFNDNTFYDVSSWTLPHAFNLPFGTIDRRNWRTTLLGNEITTSELPAGKISGQAKVAYAIDWNHYSAPAAINSLLQKGLQLRVARKPFSSETAEGEKNFSVGTVLIPVGIQPITKERLFQILLETASNHHVNISAVNSGYSLSGIDIGSSSLRPLQAPKPLLLTGSGTSAYDTGELWFLMDQHLEMAVSQINLNDFSRIELENYTHLILTRGSYHQLIEKHVEEIRAWIQQGGVLIAMKSAAKWAADHKLIDVDFSVEPENSSEEKVKAKSYAAMEKDNAHNVIGGSIFSTEIDITHPLAYGYQRNFLPVFRNHTLIMKPSSNPYATIVRYNKEPLLSGFVSNENLEQIADSAAMIAERKGEGSVILILDNPVFRGFWYGSSRLFVNSLFFGRSFQNPAGS